MSALDASQDREGHEIDSGGRSESDDEFYEGFRRHRKPSGCGAGEAGGSTARLRPG